MRFRPPCCPHAACPSNTGPSNAGPSKAGPSKAGAEPFDYQRFGTYRRECDGRVVPRFRCAVCRRTFSTQTFRHDHQLRMPWIDPVLVQHFLSGVSMRGSARALGVKFETVARRRRRFEARCREFHGALLLGPVSAGPAPARPGSGRRKRKRPVAA